MIVLTQSWRLLNQVLSCRTVCLYSTFENLFFLAVFCRTVFLPNKWFERNFKNKSNWHLDLITNFRDRNAVHITFLNEVHLAGTQWKQNLWNLHSLRSSGMFLRIYILMLRDAKTLIFLKSTGNSYFSAEINLWHLNKSFGLGNIHK